MASGIENIPSRKLPAAKWAPPDLVELYNSGSAQANADVPANPFRGIVADHLLTKFVTDFRMETFWNALKPHWNQRRHSEVRQPLYGATLLYICQQHIADWRGMPEETTARRIARFRKIERWAAGLLKELESSGESRHLTADRCMDDASIIALWRVLAPNPIRCIAGDSPPDWDDELRIVWLRMTLSDSIPAFTEQLRGCLEFASSMIKAGGSTRPELGNARADHKARHLALNLCRYFRNAYGQPLHRQVAVITEVVTDVVLDVHAIGESDRVSNRRIAAKTKAAQKKGSKVTEGPTQNIGKK